MARVVDFFLRVGCLWKRVCLARRSLRSDWSKNDFARSKFFDCRGTSVFGTGTCTSSGIITIKICDIILRPLSLFVRATKRTTGHLVTMVCTCFNGCWDDGSLHDCDTRLRTHQYRLAVIRLARAHRLARRFFSRVAMSAAAARVIAHAACAWGLASAASARAAGPAVRSHPQCATVPTFVSRPRCASLTRAVYRHVEAVGDGRDATSYEVYPVAGDGRCLFRSVAAATAIRADGARLSPTSRPPRRTDSETSPSTNSDDAAPRWSGSSRAISTRTATPCDARSRGAASPRYSCSRTSSSPPSRCSCRARTRNRAVHRRVRRRRVPRRGRRHPFPRRGTLRGVNTVRRIVTR